MIQDPAVGAIVRADTDTAFSEAVSIAVDDHARPALAGYREALHTSVLPTARDDEHPGICYLPDGDAMYEAMTRLHTSMRYSADELHAVGREIVDQVLDEMVETGFRLFGTTNVPEIFERLSDPSLRYRTREEMLEHAQRVVAAAEAEAPKWFATVPGTPCTVAPVPEAEEVGMTSAYYMPGAIDGSRTGTYYLNTSQPEKRHRRRRRMAGQPAGRRHGPALVGLAPPARRRLAGRARPAPRLEVEAEIDRYISFPGQALAYMVGRRMVRLHERGAAPGCALRPQGIPRPRAAGRDPSVAGARPYRRAVGGAPLLVGRRRRRY